ncbi:MAG: endopeptidase La [Verrucomicrobiota bacterium]|nr:endopeptidase La [Limisphaera sp.]MDW8382962.1 endopeptidase La [Verrucomicrobiota bacterium]
MATIPRDSPDTEYVSIHDVAKATGAPARISSRALPETLPVLGLSDIVIFPGMVTPLLVESAASIRLIDDVAAGDRLLAVALQREPELENPRITELHPVGCAVRLLKLLKFPDGNARILVEGLWRIGLRETVQETPYLVVRYDLLRDQKDDSVETLALLRSAQAGFQDIARQSSSVPEQTRLSALNAEDPGHFADLVAAQLNLSLEERQKLLEIVSVRDRLKRLVPLIQREREVLSLSSKIQAEVASAITKSQRDYFLREQLRIIRRELGEEEGPQPELRNLRQRVEQASLPDEVRQVARQELQRLELTPPASPEYAVARNYLDWILALPWDQQTEDTLDLARAARILDEDHYGLEKVKERLLEFIAVIKRRRELKGPILCLVGPPGTGKTSLGRSMARALGRKFAHLSLGGLRDEAEIRGHRRTYVGAMPGRILQTLRRLETRNPVIVLDELDKVGNDARGDPAAALLEVLDPAQNYAFVDHYLDLPFDLSRVLFLATANWLEPVPPALRDRLEVIELPGYTESEKLQIARRHLWPRQLQEHGLSRGEVTLPVRTVRRLVREYTREAGVRQLERDLAALARKVTRKILEPASPKASLPLCIRPQDLPEFFGPPRYPGELVERIREAGIVHALAWTPYGGEVLCIEVTRMPGRGQLLLTGSLGEVMKESAQAALSCLRSHANRLGLPAGDPDEKLDRHIHIPAGAIPKDGPSAGLALFAALVSLELQRPVRSDLGLTGEITLQGRVLQVGGIREKLLAAARHGLRRVVLPEANRGNWEEAPAEVRNRLQVRFVRHVEEILPWIFSKA